MKFTVAYSRRAEFQLQSLYDYIANASGEARADGFVGRITDYCDSLRSFPLRGRPRFDIRPGLRTVSYRRRVTIAHDVEDGKAVIIGIFYGGQNYESLLSGDD